MTPAWAAACRFRPRPPALRRGRLPGAPSPPPSRQLRRAPTTGRAQEPAAAPARKRCAKGKRRVSREGQVALRGHKGKKRSRSRGGPRDEEARRDPPRRRALRRARRRPGAGRQSPCEARCPRIASACTTSTSPSPAPKGEIVTQAGEHPYAMTTSFRVNSEELPEGGLNPHEALRDVLFTQMPGFAGAPTAVPACSTEDFLTLHDSRRGQPVQLPRQRRAGSGGRAALDQTGRGASSRPPSTTSSPPRAWRRASASGSRGYR